MPRLKQSTNVATMPVALATAPVAAPDSIFGRSFTFRFRQHNKNSNFSGLWEFAILDEKGNIEKLISDADALNFCIDNLMGELESEGF